MKCKREWKYLPLFPFDGHAGNESSFDELLVIAKTRPVNDYADLLTGKTERILPDGAFCDDLTTGKTAVEVCLKELTRGFHSFVQVAMIRTPATMAFHSGKVLKSTLVAFNAGRTFIENDEQLPLEINPPKCPSALVFDADPIDGSHSAEHRSGRHHSPGRKLERSQPEQQQRPVANRTQTLLESIVLIQIN